MTDFLFSLPLWLLAVVLNVWLVGTALVGLFVVRRWVLPRMGVGYQDASFEAAVAQSGMLLYALIAALTAVGVWQRYTAVSGIVSGEATAIASLWRDLGGYPQPLRAQTQDVLRGYTEQVVQIAWPQQRRGETPRDGVEWMDRLQALLQGFEPATESQKLLHAETLRAFNNLVTQRRLRVDSVQATLPGVMWWVLLPGAVGCIGLCLFFRTENARIQAVLLAGLAGFLAMVLFVIIALDRPYAGATGIGADSYQLIIDHNMKQ